MIKTQEEKKGSNWYVFLIIGILIGAVLGYYASEKGLIKQKVVGKNVCYDTCRINNYRNTCSKETNVDDWLNCLDSVDAMCEYGCK